MSDAARAKGVELRNGLSSVGLWSDAGGDLAEQVLDAFAAEQTAAMQSRAERAEMKAEQYQRQLDDKWAGVTALTNKAVEETEALRQQSETYRRDWYETTKALEQSMTETATLRAALTEVQDATRSLICTANHADGFSHTFGCRCECMYCQRWTRALLAAPEGQRAAEHNTEPFVFDDASAAYVRALEELENAATLVKTMSNEGTTTMLVAALEVMEEKLDAVEAARR